MKEEIASDPFRAVTLAGVFSDSLAALHNNMLTQQCHPGLPLMLKPRELTEEEDIMPTPQCHPGLPSMLKPGELTVENDVMPTQQCHPGLPLMLKPGELTEEKGSAALPGLMKTRPRTAMPSERAFATWRFTEGMSMLQLLSSLR